MAIAGLGALLPPALLAGPKGEVTHAVAASRQAALDAWIGSFRGRARAAGIPRTVFDRSMRNVRYRPDVLERYRNQSEFTKALWDYLDTAVSPARVRNGKAMLRRHRALLDAIERRYGVEREVVVAIWGIESAYGAVRGKTPVLDALATLAMDSGRRDFFAAQLIAALKILDGGHTSLTRLRGSWAGAMGHTQFIPTSWAAFAVDFDGDGYRDIWSDDPADALASAANYLARHGWKTGQPWGVEVRLPKGFDYALARRDLRRLPSEWARSGVVGLDGRPVPDHGPASVLVPAGHRGAAFLIFDNFAVLERYNTADAYVIAVGHLADRLRGGGPIRAAWPRDERVLTYAERIELQRRLRRAGFDPRRIDGRIGPLTIGAVRAWQRAHGRVPDGFASLSVLRALREGQ